VGQVGGFAKQNPCPSTAGVLLKLPTCLINLNSSAGTSAKIAATVSEEFRKDESGHFIAVKTIEKLIFEDGH
jgi:hypothetical protein